VVAPGSHCFACGKPVRWYDNVPLVSWLWLRGKCRDCGAAFSARYLLVEALTGVLFAVVWWHCVDAGAALEPLGTRLVRAFVYATFATILVVITFIDLDHKLILDKITYPAIPAFYGLGLLLPERHWSEGLIGAAVGYGVVRLIADGYWLITKREGMGYGDGKLLAIIGALFGWRAVLVSLFGGAVIGSVVGITALLLAKRAEPAPEHEQGHEDEEDDRAAVRAVPRRRGLRVSARGAVVDRAVLRLGRVVVSIGCRPRPSASARGSCCRTGCGSACTARRSAPRGRGGAICTR
jgi:leader peptidase (prepilin peptidase)/N-methyltransferase